MATATPASIGQLYIDTTNGALYIAQSTAEGDWAGVGGSVIDTSVPYVSAFAASQGGPGVVIAKDGNNSISLSGGTITFDAGGSTPAEMTSTAVVLGLPINTSNVATVTSPSVSTGVAFTPGATGDCFLSWYISHAGTLTVTMGPSTGAEHTIYSAVAVLADGAFDIWVPAGWKVVITLASSATISNVTATLV